jgi:hypothetical protein
VRFYPRIASFINASSGGSEACSAKSNVGGTSTPGGPFGRRVPDPPRIKSQMTRAEFDKLPREERYHFVLCEECGDYIDMRQRDEVMRHNTKHRPRPEVRYTGSDD